VAAEKRLTNDECEFLIFPLEAHRSDRLVAEEREDS